MRVNMNVYPRQAGYIKGDPLCLPCVRHWGHTGVGQPEELSLNRSYACGEGCRWKAAVLGMGARQLGTASPKHCLGSKRRAVSWVLKDEPKFSRRTVVLGEFRQKEEPRGLKV